MKKLLTLVVLATTVLSFQSALVAENTVQPPAVIKLDLPKLDKGISIMQALNKRQSVRDFSDKTLTKQQISEILWAADGKNRSGGERTAPSAMHKYPVDIYAVLADGIYLYNSNRHDLTIVASGDYRKQTGMQDFVYTAPLNLVFVADLDKLNYGKPGQSGGQPENEKMVMAAIEAGCQVQNVYLYCASEGLGTVIRGSLDKEAFSKAIKASPSQRVICAQTVGVPAAKK